MANKNSHPTTTMENPEMLTNSDKDCINKRMSYFIILVQSEPQFVFNMLNQHVLNTYLFVLLI